MDVGPGGRRDKSDRPSRSSAPSARFTRLVAQAVIVTAVGFLIGGTVDDDAPSACLAVAFSVVAALEGSTAYPGSVAEGIAIATCWLVSATFLGLLAGR